MLRVEWQLTPHAFDRVTHAGKMMGRVGTRSESRPLVGICGIRDDLRPR